jgi:hypothetical protein
MVQKNERIWVEWERDPLCFLRLLKRPGRLLRGPRRIAFTFVSLSDPGPWLGMAGKTLVRILSAAARKLTGAGRR